MTGKLLLVLAIFLFLLTTPVLASKDKERNRQDNEVKIEQEECDSNDFWKNHGEYVSCVAKLRLGGTIVSEAAKSDTGKKDKDNENEATLLPSVSPSASPSATPSVSPSPVGIGTTTGGAANITLEGANLEIGALIQFLQNLIDSLKNLMTD